MRDLDPIEVLKELSKNKGDEVVEIFIQEYIAMTETLSEMFKEHGYELLVRKVINKDKCKCMKYEKIINNKKLNGKCIDCGKVFAIIYDR